MIPLTQPRSIHHPTQSQKESSELAFHPCIPVIRVDIEAED
jgi:hypothetical protein